MQPSYSQLVHREDYFAVSNYVDSRNAAGTGTVDFLAHDWRELWYWAWNREALDDSTGARVLYDIDGYQIWYTSSDDYVEHQTAREDENDRQLYRSVMLLAVLDPPQDAIGAVGGMGIHTIDEWNMPWKNYKTQEDHVLTLVHPKAPNVQSGHEIDRVEFGGSLVVTTTTLSFNPVILFQLPPQVTVTMEAIPPIMMPMPMP